MVSYIFGGDTGQSYDSLQRKRDLSDAMLASALSKNPKNYGEAFSVLGDVMLTRALSGKADKGLAEGKAAYESGPRAALVDALMGAGTTPQSDGYTADMQAAAQNSPGVQAINDLAPGASPIESGPQLASLAYANQGAIRDDAVNAGLQHNIQSSIYDVFGPGYSTEVYSGGQPGKGEGGARTGSIRHDHGNAADIRVLDPQGNTVTGDALSPLGQYWQAQGYGGTGMEMRGGGVHLDNWTPDMLKPGMGMYWGYGDQGGSYTPEMQSALARGAGGESPYFTMSRFPQEGPIPTPNAQARTSAPVPSVEAIPLAPVRGDRVTSPSITPEGFQGRVGENTPPQSPSQVFAAQPGTPAPPLQAPVNVQSAPVPPVQPQQQPTLTGAMMQRQSAPQVPMNTLMDVMGSPYASAGDKQLAQVLLERQMQASDPMRQLQMQKAQLEIDNLRNPQPKPTDDMREYEFARTQGYQGSFQDFMTEMKRAGASSTTVNNNMKGETKFDEEFGKNLATRAIDIMDAGQQAPSKIAQYQALGSALQNTYTGTGGDAVLSARRAAQSLGIDVGDVGDGEFAKALGNQIALQLRSPSGGAGMPGALSDKDREFLVSMVPNLQKTPEGNARLVDMMTKVEERNMQVSQLARDYMSRNGGRLDYGFYDELAQWSAQNPLFADVEDPAQAPAGNTTSSGVKWSIE